MHNFSEFKKRTEEIAEWLSEEFLSLQTGRATPAILDKVLLDAYGSKMAIRDVATISTLDPRTLRISPWDATQIKAIEKAIITSNIGLSVSIDEKGLRAFSPELTSERREVLAKVVRAKLEDAKVSLKKEREEVWQDIQKKEKNKEISEDEKFKLKEEMQKITDEANKKLEETAEKKEKEILI